ncbi:hypothetical protein MtrunA17_Chr3g0103701 [Medicago truncatula]|uniref:Uncharacterized protein n=1 Tax=Medicago truncatula TaxID=3880 RepID=A0A396ISR4_MEDTR|nr:hypothetical protein MtrunA17_Chr3g0103701 [Medicago truncatula]
MLFPRSSWKFAGWKFYLVSNGDLEERWLIGRHRCYQSSISGKIEVVYNCTGLQVARKQLKVQYDDVQDEDESGNLEVQLNPSFEIF